MFNSYGVGTTAAVGLFAMIALAFAVSVTRTGHRTLPGMNL